MSNNNPSEKLSFWELINKHTIKIPIIQRDYAQGRKDKEEIRNTFLTSLFNAFQGDNLLELDFVYGSVNNESFLPLDGQQRLTTLFLLHWYIASKEEKISEVKETLQKFTYETRSSSREFCTELIKEGIDFEKLLEDKNPISTTIKDSHWFFLSWQKDPTIKAMLIMLDAIHEKFNNSSIGLWRKLTTDNKITFQYIELERFGLADDLYIKMNARGKALTEFENFKAKFEQYIHKYPSDLKGAFLENIDGIWADLFWNYRDKTNNLFDAKIMNFFRVMATNHYAVMDNDNKDDFNTNVGLLQNKKKSLSFGVYDRLRCFDKNYLELIIRAMNKLSFEPTLKHYLQNKSYLNEKEIFEKVISDADLGYADLIIFYAYTQYLASEENIDSMKLAEWMRIIRNLVEAGRSHNFNNAEEYAKILKSITTELLPNRNDILNFLKDSKPSDIKGFRKEDIEEEILKAKLISQNTDWKKAILEIENHPYFKGQVGFLLDWSDGDIIEFRNYAEKIKLIFLHNGLNKFPDFLFERALLAEGNYLLQKGQNHSFLVNDERDISWKRLLRDKSDKRELIKSLLDKIELIKSLLDKINTISLEKYLNAVIDNFNNENDWRYYFIKHPKLISSCGKDKFIRWKNEKNILLLGSSKTSGYHTEYYIYALYLKLINKIKNINDKGIWQNSISYPKTFSFGPNPEYTVTFQQEKYKIGLSASESILFDDQKSLIEYLKTQNFISTNV